MLHGILDYIGCAQLASYQFGNLELSTSLAKLRLVDTTEQQEYYSGLPLPEAVPVIEPVGPDNPPWNSGIAFLVWLGSVLLVAFVPLIFLLLYVSVSGAQLTDQSALAEFATKDPTSVLIQVAAILPVHLLTLVICWFVVTNFRKFDFRDTLGWLSGGIRWWHYVVILISFFALAATVGYLVPEQENELLRIIKSSKWALYTVAFLAVFTAPLVEEVVYRGVVYSAFQRSAGTMWAIAITTLLFTAIHVPQYLGSPSTIFLLAVLSLILTLVRVQTGNLWPCIVLHTIFNAIQSALLIVEPYVNVPGTIPVEKAAAVFIF